jgi:hypothetical protein
MESAYDDGEFIKVNINEYLAYKFWNDYNENQKPPIPYTLNNVVEALVSEDFTNAESIKADIIFFVKNLTDQQIVLDPFRKLAKISNIATFLTVNYDNFLERAFEK